MKIGTLWIGDRFGPIEVLSALSFLRQGMELTVFTTSEVENIPEGITVRDARDIFHTEPILRYAKSGSPALHANLFRYAMIAKTDLIWADLDIIALRPFDFDSEYVFGYETPKLINNAVLRLPKDSPALAELQKITPATRGLPPHTSGLNRAKYWLKGMGRGLPITRWPWGSTGPCLLTRILQQTGEARHALPISAFYGIPFDEADQLLDPYAVSTADLPREAYAIHLWHNRLNRILTVEYGGKIPANCYLDTLAHELALK